MERAENGVGSENAVGIGKLECTLINMLRGSEGQMLVGAGVDDVAGHA